MGTYWLHQGLRDEGLSGRSPLKEDQIPERARMARREERAYWA